MAGLFRTMGFLCSGCSVVHNDNAVMVTILSQHFYISFCYRLSPLGTSKEVIPKKVTGTKYYPQLLPDVKTKKGEQNAVELSHAVEKGHSYFVAMWTVEIFFFFSFFNRRKG